MIRASVGKRTLVFKSQLNSCFNSGVIRLYATAQKPDDSKKPSSHGFSDTVILPKTDFPNRSGSQEAIQKLIKRSSDDLYQWQYKSDKFQEKSVFHDGPPYANAKLHLGHAMNKILKDIINRFELMKGKKVEYIPGWDCHGLPIELKALQTLSEKAKTDVSTVLSPTEIRTIARQHALQAIDDQKKSFKSFGVMGDWDNSYRTLDPDYEVRQLNVFKEMLHRGYISRKIKPVYWGTETRTALAEAELEYNDSHKSTAVYVKFPLYYIDDRLKKILNGQIPSNKTLHALIWTTTPWTLVANRAIAVNPDLHYVVVKHKKHGYLIVAEARLEELGEEYEIVESIKSFRGKVLTSSTYKNPLLNFMTAKDQPILAAEYVTSTAGTGLVHTAPGHGFDDYQLCSKHKIDSYSPVDDEGKYTKDVPEELEQISGLFVLNKGQKEVIKILENNNALVSINRKYIHKYPYDWRSKLPIIIRSTPQWFADVDAVKKNAIKSLQKVHFHPSNGRNRLEAFTESRSEWCISRQRVWGVPIPAIYNKETGEPLTEVATMDHIISKIAEFGTNAWFEEEDNVQRWLPKTKEFQGKGAKYFKGKDTMDVWFDSGTSWTMLENREKDGKYLADYYLEGSDQHRGWFQSSLLTKMSVSKKAKAPFRNIITHGFTLDEKGQKMSKSLGNTISPETVMKGKKGQWLPLGVDGLRLWVASSDYTKDVSVGPTILKNTAENLKKLRFTLRFLLGNLSSYNPKEFGDFDPKKFHPVDLYILHLLKKMADTAKEHYESFAFNRVMQTVNYHTSTELSAFYFDIIKDRLYAAPEKSVDRQAALFVLNEILKVYMSVLSPITPLLTQEAWDHSSPHIQNGLDSPFKAGWYELPEVYENEEIAKEFSKIEGVIKIVNQAMESARVAKSMTSSLSCDVNLHFKEGNEIADLLKKYEPYLAELLICSQVNINPTESSSNGAWVYESSSTIDGVEVRAETIPTQHHKCPRCWQYTAEEEDKLCHRCEDAVSQL